MGLVQVDPCATPLVYAMSLQFQCFMEGALFDIREDFDFSYLDYVRVFSETFQEVQAVSKESQLNAKSH